MKLSPFLLGYIAGTGEEETLSKQKHKYVARQRGNQRRAEESGGGGLEGEEEGMASGAWSPRWFLLRGDGWPADTELAEVLNEHPAARRKGSGGGRGGGCLG